MNKENNTGKQMHTPEQEHSKHMESQQSHTYALEKESNLASGKLVETLKIPHTPFHTVTIETEEGQKHFIAIGNKRVTELYTDITDAIDTIHERNWDLICSLVVVITERVIEAIKQEDKEQQKEWKKDK